MSSVISSGKFSSPVKFIFHKTNFYGPHKLEIYFCTGFLDEAQEVSESCLGYSLWFISAEELGFDILPVSVI